MSKRLLLLLVSVTLGCDSIPRSLDEDDCRAWVEHFVALAKSAAHDAVAACAKEAAASPDLTAKMIRNAEEQQEKRRDAFLEDCRKDLGKKYAPPEARCFNQSKQAKEWASCPFKINVLYHLTDAQKQIAAKADADCVAFLEGNEGKPKK